jgi:hypothetical protein
MFTPSFFEIACVVAIAFVTTVANKIITWLQHYSSGA